MNRLLLVFLFSFFYCGGATRFAEFGSSSEESYSKGSISTDLPDSYDVRVAYPGCRDIFNYVAKSFHRCGDCYSMVAAMMLNHGLCIKNPQSSFFKKMTISSYWTLACSGLIDAEERCNGGGYNVLRKIITNEAPSGSMEPHDIRGCWPYQLPYCSKEFPYPGEICPPEGQKFHINRAANCSTLVRNKCQDPTVPLVLYGINSILNFVATNVDAMKAAIAQDGQIIAAVYVGEEFRKLRGSYEIYRKNETGETNHYVMLIGFRSEWQGSELVHFWIGKNSVGTLFGLNGFFRIESGRNLNGIESEVYRVSVRNTMSPLPKRLRHKRRGEDGKMMNCLSLAAEKACRCGYKIIEFEKREVEYACFDQNVDLSSYIQDPNFEIPPPFVTFVAKIEIPILCEKKNIFTHDFHGFVWG